RETVSWVRIPLPPPPPEETALLRSTPDAHLSQVAAWFSRDLSTSRTANPASFFSARPIFSGALCTFAIQYRGYEPLIRRHSSLPSSKYSRCRAPPRECPPCAHQSSARRCCRASQRCRRRRR